MAKNSKKSLSVRENTIWRLKKKVSRRFIEGNEDVDYDLIIQEALDEKYGTNDPDKVMPDVKPKQNA